jgi:hypothetical protein
VRRLLVPTALVALVVAAPFASSARKEDRVLSARGAIQALAADGERVAVLVEPSRSAPCARVLVWTPGLRRVDRMRAPRCGEGSVRELALAGERLALIHADEGAYEAKVLYTATVSERKPVEAAASLARRDGGEGTHVGNLRGDGGLLAFNLWHQCTRRDDLQRPDRCPRGVSRGIDSDSVWRFARTGEAAADCPERLLSRGTLPACLPLQQTATARQLLAVDAGRLVVREADNGVMILGSNGRNVLAIEPSGLALAGVLHSDDLVLLVRGEGHQHSLDVFDAETGEQRARWEVPATPRLTDLHDGVAVYALHGIVHLQRIDDGREAVISPPGRGPVQAQLEANGLYYSYRIADEQPGRVAFLPWDDVEERLGG